MQEQELSLLFSVPSTLYTRLFLCLQSFSLKENYTEKKRLIKCVYKCANNEYVRTIQDESGFQMQKKKKIEEKKHTGLYKHIPSNLTLFVSIIDKTSIETYININNYLPNMVECQQTIRDYVYSRESGIRIAIERKFTKPVDSAFYNLTYDSFNRHKFDCFIHLELEYIEDYNDNRCELFINQLAKDELIFSLLNILAIKNLNITSDEIINIHNITLQHKYGHGQKPDMSFYSLKFDGIRKNFCIFGKYLQIDGKSIEFVNHWFGQTIVGHCEMMESGEIIIIDVYIVSENFSKIAKKYNLSYSGALQHYHHFYNNNKNSSVNSTSPKTQDEYFHMKRLASNILFMDPLESINVIRILEVVWQHESDLRELVKLQTFFTHLSELEKCVNGCFLKIDGCLGYTKKKIYKIKTNLTVDLIIKFDDLFRCICKRMKSNNSELKKIIYYRNIQKTLDWIEFEKKFPNKFNELIPEFLFFSNNKSFLKFYTNWKVAVDLDKFVDHVSQLNSTFSVLLLEFDIDVARQCLVFSRLRTDKFSPNSIKVFRNMLEQL